MATLLSVSLIDALLFTWLIAAANLSVVPITFEEYALGEINSIEGSIHGGAFFL